MPTPMTRSLGPVWLFWGVFCLVILAYTAGLAIGPRVSGPTLEQRTPDGRRLNCLTAIDLPGPFGILLNCDSPLFMEMASQPHRLLEPNNIRQSRPGQIWLAWLVSKPISAFTSAFVAFANRGDVQLPEGATRTRAQAIADLAPGFVAYYLINIALLAASVGLLASSARHVGLSCGVVALAGSLLVFNDVTKAYLVAPHSQLMNIVIPMVLVTLLFRAFTGAPLTLRYVMALAAVSGAGLLAYATWILVPLVVLVGIGWAWAAGGNQWEASRRHLVWFPVVVALTVLPYAAWYVYVVKHVGFLYQHEMTQDGGLVWVFRTPPADLVNRLIGTVGALLGMAAGQALPYLAFGTPAAVALLLGGVRLSAADQQQALRAVLAAAVVSSIFLAFFALLGFRIWRYAVPLLPAWSLPLGLLNAMIYRQIPEGPKRRYFVGLLLAIACAIGLFQVAKEGPWG